MGKCSPCVALAQHSTAQHSIAQHNTAFAQHTVPQAVLLKSDALLTPYAIGDVLVQSESPTCTE